MCRPGILPPCGIVGAIGWLVYWVMMLVQPSAVLASLVAVIPLTVATRVFAVVRRAPVTLFLIPGIFPLVPGAGIYYTAYAFITGDTAQCAAKGAETLKIAVALAMGKLQWSVIPRKPSNLAPGSALNENRKIIFIKIPLWTATAGGFFCAKGRLRAKCCPNRPEPCSRFRHSLSKKGRDSGEEKIRPFRGVRRAVAHTVDMAVDPVDLVGRRVFCHRPMCGRWSRGWRFYRAI